MCKLYISGIEYDTDGIEVDLPNELTIEVPDEVINNGDVGAYIDDQISNQTGFCVTGYFIDDEYKNF